MSSLHRNKLFSFANTLGFATDLSPLTRGVEYLSLCENAYFEASNSIRKFGGSSKINSTVLSGAPDVTGFVDFWRSGTGGTSTQNLVLMTSDSKIYADTTSGQDGTFTDITGSATLTANAIPYFFIARDTLVILDSAGDTPLSWAQSGNVSTLAGSPPAGRVGIYHVNRPWIANTNANPSRLTYGSSTSVTDFTGADTGTIDVQPEDGDRIIGLAVLKGTLLVFKGPNKGSIHAISGRTAATFVQDKIMDGNPLQTPHGLLPVGNDIWMLTDTGVYSVASVLQTSADWNKADITQFHKKFFRDNINRAQMAKAYSTNYEDRSMALFSMADASSTENNLTFGISYLATGGDGAKFKYFTIPGRGCISSGIRINPTTRLRELVFGGTDGFIRRQDVVSRSIDGSAGYTYRVRTPSILIGDVNEKTGDQRIDQPVQLNGFFVRSEPLGNYNLAVALQRDDQAEQTFNLNQGSSGFVLDSSQLDVGTLGGGVLQIKHDVKEFKGRCRAVTIDLQNSGSGEDINVYEFGVYYDPVGESKATGLYTNT